MKRHALIQLISRGPWADELPKGRARKIAALDPAKRTRKPRKRTIITKRTTK